MKFTELRIDGFGVWSGLEIRALDSALNVLFGPNEAGKTTLLEFIRAVLYGFSLNRRRRYLPPVRGGETGGWLGIAAAGATLQIRRAERSNAMLGEVTVAAADGTVQGESQLAELLGDVDEAIFQNVFALGLEELQHLGVLDATDAARLLYGLSAGMDRVSLSEVMQELDISRRRMLCDEGQSRIGDLLSQRGRLCEEIDRLGESAGEYWRLAGQREELATAIGAAETEVARLEREARVRDLARSLAPKWNERAALDERLAAIEPLKDFPPNALARMRQITSGIRRHRRRLDRIRSRRKQLRAEIGQLAIREPLWRLAPRIESLAENESWIASVEKELQGAKQAVEQFEAQMAAGRGKLGIPTATGGEPLDLSPRSLAALRAPAAELRRAIRAAREAQAVVKQAEQDVEVQWESLEAALSARGLKELNPAIEQAGQAVAQWRRRVQLDDRLERMARHRTELEDETHASLDRQIMPGWMLASLGAVFVVGVLLLFASWLLPGTFSGTPGWALALLGISAFGGAVATKFILERSAARRLDACQKQLVVLESQTKQLQDERTALDKQLPSGGTPSARLQTAESELAALEELLPLEAKRQSAEQHLPLAQREAEQAKGKLREAHEAWQSALAAVGLPKKLTPKQIRQLRRSARGRADLRVQYTAAREQRDRIQRELAALTARIEPLFAESGLTPTSESPSERLRQLGRELADEKTRATRRDSMVANLKRLVVMRGKRRSAIQRLRRRGKALLHRAGVANRAELRRKAAERAAADDLAQRREQLHRELAAACTGICEPAEIAGLLDGAHRAELIAQSAGATSQTASPIDAARDRLHELLEQRGRLGREMESLADDRRLDGLQLQLAATEQALAESIERWQVLCVTLRILQQIKEDYERRGQPETLLTASEYLNRLTDGRYRRVWTPLGENALLVDNADGSSLAVELMSRGAREQLFLALRLALVDYYRRREIEMPLVLDDVLVNFDDERSGRAAELLRDFAAAGHQLLVFTCHERLATVFESLGVPVRRLPKNTEPGQIIEPVACRPIVTEAPAEEPPPRRRRSKPAKPVEVQEIAEPVEPIPESAVELVIEPVIELPATESTNGHTTIAIAEPAPVPVVALPLAAVEILAEPIEVAVPPVRQHRADPPHPIARPEPQQPIRRRWSAEEFAGELEDRVRQPNADDQPAAG